MSIGPFHVRLRVLHRSDGLGRLADALVVLEVESVDFAARSFQWLGEPELVVNISRALAYVAWRRADQRLRERLTSVHPKTRNQPISRWNDLIR